MSNVPVRQDLLEAYLERALGGPATVLSVRTLGETDGELKGFGYGVPLRIDVDCSGRRKTVVLATVRPSKFGHEHMADRAQLVLWSHDAFNRLPRHACSIDAGAFLRDGSMVSLGDAEEFFEVREFVEGRGYFEDLIRMRDSGAATKLDLSRSDALCDYLVEIHRVRGGEPALYARRIRELIGHAECIMGLADSYPKRHGFITWELLERIEQRCVSWRWRLKDRVHRLRQVHGDFHPWNVLFRDGTDFTALDRSRGEWGEPADDVSCMSMNYLFFSLQRSERLEGGFETLFRRFWDRYLEATGDSELLRVVAPFFAFRGLVMASPVWYPNLRETVRRKIFTFVERALDADAFEPAKAGAYCE